MTTTFHAVLREAALAHGDRVALRWQDQALSYAQLLERAESLAAGFAARGVGPADRLAIIMDNSLDCLLAWLASSLIGCVEVPINPQYRGGLLHYLLADGDISAVICDAAYLGGLLDVADRVPALRLIVVSGAGSLPGNAPIAFADLARCFAPGGFAGNADAPERVILYTSGTTGPSKGVVHTQTSSLVLARYNAEVMGYGPEDRLLNFFPLFHQNARYTGVMPALVSGAAIRIERKLSTSTFWQTCDADGITAFNYLGSVLRMILNVTGPERRAGTHSVTRAFGAGAAPAVWRAFEERLGIRLHETYGLSEAPMATLNLPGAARAPFGSAGRASALFDVAVVDARDAPLPPGAVGEIVLRPRRPDALMLGYHNKAEATVRAFRNLWFHSGDRGYLSAQGELFFEERSKDSIRRRGENISAWEVESVVELHPAVAEAAVYGLPSGEFEEDVAITLVPANGTLDPAAVIAFARARLPDYAVPTLLRVATDLPRTPTAKIRKDELRAIGRAGHIAFAPPPRGAGQDGEQQA